MIKPNPLSQGNSHENLLTLVSICFFSSDSLIFKDFIEQLPFFLNFLKGYKTAPDTENLPYYTYSFQLIKQSTSSLREVINHKVKFCIMQAFNKNNNAYACLYVCMHGRQTGGEEINQTLTFWTRFAYKQFIQH